jgi:hypothetical protein
MLGIAATTVVIPGNVSVSSGNTVLGGNVNISRSYARKSGQSALVIYEANGNDGTSSSGSLVLVAVINTKAPYYLNQTKFPQISVILNI